MTGAGSNGCDGVSLGAVRAFISNSLLLGGSSREKSVPTVWVSNRQPLQGETIAVRVSVPPPNSPVGHLRNFFRAKVGGGLVNMSIEEELRVDVRGAVKTIPVFRDGSDGCALHRRWCGYVPSTPLDNPGKRLLTVRVEDGRHWPRTMELRIRKRPFDMQSIWIDEDKAELLEGCSSTELEKVDGSLRTASPVRLWRGGFLRPCSGPVTTEYGVSRTYNGVPREGYFHGGLDYGAPEGTPVISPADGRVVLVGEETDGFPYHGTCVTVDHGHGVTSLLMHLSASAVKTGDVVRAGQLVGAVGETGIATGPHLHWGLHVGGDAVDPNGWLV